ncbi:hypothetical protein T07_11142 [Trichinella nelsoni]|uniref:Uncharacterized protein n=1 Tax=Trichinella nelsoni TaxID=6336 RepID=A0A0V0RP45_9BILA|nr:hypothetical protein T07_11142 [Trichinella nelsoni]
MQFRYLRQQTRNETGRIVPSGISCNATTDRYDRNRSTLIACGVGQFSVDKFVLHCIEQRQLYSGASVANCHMIQCSHGVLNYQLHHRGASGKS